MMSNCKTDLLNELVKESYEILDEARTQNKWDDPDLNKRAADHIERQGAFMPEGFAPLEVLKIYQDDWEQKMMKEIMEENERNERKLLDKYRN